MPKKAHMEEQIVAVLRKWKRERQWATYAPR